MLKRRSVALAISIVAIYEIFIPTGAIANVAASRRSLTGAASSSSSAEAPNLPKIREAAFQCASRKLGLSSSKLTLQASVVQSYPESGQELYRHTVIAKETGALALCDIDRHGNEAQEYDFAEAERVARVAHHGRLHPMLEAILSTMAPSARRRVLVQIPVHEPQGAAGSNLIRTPEAVAAEMARVDAEVSARLPRVLALLPKGTPVRRPTHGSPFLFAQMSAPQIAALSRSNEIGYIYDADKTQQIPLEDKSVQRLLEDMAQPTPGEQPGGRPGTFTCRVNHVMIDGVDQTHQQIGSTGAGVKVSTLETVCSNPYLPFDPTNPVYAETPQNCNELMGGAYHGGEMLGYIQNTNPTDPEMNPPDPNVYGIAPHAVLYSANGASIADSYIWLQSNGIAITNKSFDEGPGNPVVCPWPQSTADALGDYYALHWPYILTVAAAGNFPAPTDPACTTDRVHNVLMNGLVVGASWENEVETCAGGTCSWDYPPPPDTNRTVQWSAVGADGSHFVTNNREASSEYLGQGDRELPHLVAPGAGLQWSLSGECEATGTSAAAPQVTGVAALLSEKNSQLYGRPEALRAILMAGADVNTDLNDAMLGAAYSYQPVYNNIALGGTIDRHGGVGLLNALASSQIGLPTMKMWQNNRYGIDFSTALGGNVSANIIAYQHTLDSTIENNQIAPGILGHDYGTMDPNNDFDGIWYKNFYYFAPTTAGNLRIVLTWDRPYTCTFGTTVSCGPNYKPDLNILLRDLSNPTGSVAHSATYDPNEEFVSAPVLPGHIYRLDIYQQNYWPGPESFGLASYLTTNPQ